MQDAPTHPLPRVALSHGDFNGIGYEVMFKTFADARMFEMMLPGVKIRREASRGKT